jgi:hypothetical protein
LTSGTDLSRTDRGGGRNLPSRVTDLSDKVGLTGALHSGRIWRLVGRREVSSVQTLCLAGKRLKGRISMSAPRLCHHWEDWRMVAHGPVRRGLSLRSRRRRGAR